MEQYGGGTAADVERRLIAALVHEKVASGEVRPILVLQATFVNLVLPTLYLAVPQARRPWIYRARYVVFIAIALYNVWFARNCTSAIPVVGYGAGLAVGWATIWAFSVLICSRPQFEDERVEKRPRPRSTSPHSHQRSRSNSGNAALAESPPLSPLRADHVSALATGVDGLAAAGSNGSANGNAVRHPSRRRKSVRFVVPPDEDVARSLVDHEYYWQTFPAEAPFLTRLNWAFDYYLAWRGSGWNRAITTIPRFDPPRKPLSEELVKLDSISLVSVAGCRRYRTNRQYLLARLLRCALGYIVLDACLVLMTSPAHAPYFILGPSALSPSDHPASSLLPTRSTLPLTLSRSLINLVGIIAALEMIMGLEQLLRRVLSHDLDLLPLCGGARSELWQYPTIFGSFSNMLETGLAGFWGRYWHQSFRLGFTGPSILLKRVGILSRPPRESRLSKTIISILSFLLSGVLHFFASCTTPRASRPWMSWSFFVLQSVGIFVQATYAALMRRRIRRLPRPVRRAGNLVYAFAWLLATSWLFLDDLAWTGIWLFEPIPFSPVRALGFGTPGDPAYRWGGKIMFWHAGRHWWDSGLGM